MLVPREKDVTERLWRTREFVEERTSTALQLYDKYNATIKLLFVGLALLTMLWVRKSMVTV